MSTNKTPHYGLHLWEPEDLFMRTEFNENNEKLDAAMKEVKTTASQAVSQMAAVKCEMRSGTYVGDGAASRHINVGFAPKVVFVEREDGARPGWMCGGIALAGFPLADGTWKAVTVSGNGFIVAYGDSHCYTNQGTVRYYYVAFR